MDTFLRTRYMIFGKLLLVAVAVAIIPITFTDAVELKAVSDVSIYDARVVSQTAHYISVSYTVTNNDATTIRDMRSGVVLQSGDGELLYGDIVDMKPMVLNGNTSQNINMRFIPPPTSNGKYDVIITLENNSGSLLAQSIIDTISFTKNKGDTAKKDTKISCTLGDTQTEYICSIGTSVASISYTVLKGGLLGEVVRSGTVKPDKAGTSVHIDMSNEHGSFGIKIKALTQSKKVVAQVDNIYVSPGSWIAVSGFTQDKQKDGNIVGHLFLKGTGESETRGFVYALLDNKANVCDSGELDLRYTVPQERTITIGIPKGCESPVLSGFLYDGIHPDGTYNIVDSFGKLSPDDLAKVGVTPQAFHGFMFLNGVQPYIGWATIVFIVILLLGYGFLIKRKESISTIIIVLFVFGSIGFVVHPLVVKATTFNTHDDPNKASIDINFTKPSFLTSEPISFTFTIKNGNIKPANTSVTANIDGGSNTTIVNTSDTRTTYNISLPKVTTSGTHNLNITIPKTAHLCGSFFNKSFFTTALFGYDTCDISVPFTVIANTAPHPPVVGGSCTIGGTGANTSNITLSSVDDESNKVYYEVKFNGTNPIVRVPTVGLVQSYPYVQSTQYTGWTTQGQKTVTARAIDTQGLASSWKNGTVQCNAQCATTVTCDGGSSQLKFFASPSLVIQNTTTTLKWTLENVHDCSINGTNGDSFSWSGVVSKQTSVTTGSISAPTTYTMQCTDFNDALVTATTKVQLVPRWSEF